MSPFRRALTVVLLAAAALLAAPTTALAETAPPSAPTGGFDQEDAAQGDKDLASFGIAPAGPERADERPYLRYTVAPGTVIYDHIAVLNQGDRPVDLDVYASEVRTGAEGGLVAPAKGEPLTGSGTWLSPAMDRVSVPAQTPTAGFGFVIVPFTISVPANAQPGDHVGALVASLRVRSEASENSPGLELEQRVVARVYITVDGDLTPGLEIRSLGAHFERGGPFASGRVVVGYALVNTGNVRMRVSPHVEVSGPAGWFRHEAEGVVVEDLLPGSQVVQQVTVDGIAQLLRLSVAVTAEASAPPAGGEDPGLAPVTVTTGVWVIPWWYLLIVLLVVATIVWRYAVRRRGARGEGGGRHTGRGVRRPGPGPDGNGRTYEPERPPAPAVPAEVVPRSPERGRSFT